MAGLQPGDSAHHGVSESGPCNSSHDRLEERDKCSSNWYMIRKEIEEDSPSRKDGIDLKKEAYFRKSYCTFLQDLGMRLKVPQVTIASAIIFCHRFFLRQSHAKNDRRTVATVCMFLAGKVEETPRPLKDVILVSYEIIHKKDPAAVQRIKQKEEYEKQKELILLGERVVLATLGFDLNVHHPYKPLVDAIKKFKVAQNALAQVAWNFVNDGLRTSLCLQFKPHHIAAGAIFLAAKFLKVKLPSDGDKVWWQEFDVTPRQLEEVSNQMLELYEQNRLAPTPQSNGSEADVSDGGANNNPRSLGKTSATEEQPTSSVSGFSSQVIVSKIDESSTARQSIESDPQRHSFQNPADGMNDHNEWDCTNKGNHHLEKLVENGEMNKGRTPLEGKEEQPTEGVFNGVSGVKASTKGSSDVIKRFDKEKVKAALEKRRKNRTEDLGKKPDVMDDYDIIERELENGVEMAERERKQKKSITSSKVHSVPTNRVEADQNHAEASERSVDCREGLRREALDTNDNAEEGELSSLDVPAHPPREPSPVSNSRKRKAELSLFNRDVRPDYYHDKEHNHRNYRQEPSHV